MTLREIRQECHDDIAMFNSFIREHEEEIRRHEQEIADYRLRRDNAYARLEQLSGFPPEPTAPLVDMSDPEYNPYINKECEHDEII